MLQVSDKSESRDNIFNHMNIGCPDVISEAAFKMNFYKEVEFKSVETPKIKDRFIRVRPFVNEVWDDAEEDKLKLYTSIKCSPTVFNSTAIHYEKLSRTFEKRNQWRRLKQSDISAVKQILNRILIINDEQLWPEMFASSLALRNHTYITIVNAVIEIIIQDNYLLRPFPKHYKRLILFLINYEATLDKNHLLHDFCAYLKWKILFDNNKLQVMEVMLLTKFFAMVHTLDGDADALLDFIYDALYFLKFRSHTVLFTILTVWPEIFPKCGEHANGIIYTMAFVCLNHNMKRNSDLYFVAPLRDMLNELYSYKHGKKTAEELLVSTMRHISNDDWLKSILLLCKRQGLSWTYEVVFINHILPIINLWIAEGSSAVQDWLLIKCIHLIGTVFRNTNNIKKFYSLEDALKLFDDILFSDHQPSIIIPSAVIVQLWNLSTVQFTPCYEVLFKWCSCNDTVSNIYFRDLTKYLCTMGYYLPVKRFWRALLVFAAQNSSVEFIREKEAAYCQISAAQVKLKDRDSRPSKAVVKVSLRRRNKKPKKRKPKKQV